MKAWQPIETMPKDGGIFDVLYKGGLVVKDCWWDDDDKTIVGGPPGCVTHWSPVPQARILREIKRAAGGHN